MILKKVNRKISILFFGFLLLTFSFSFAQDKQQVQHSLAIQFFNNGEYDKAAEVFESLYKRSRSEEYYEYLYQCYAQLKNYKDGEKLVDKKIKDFPQQAAYQIDLGYIFFLQEDAKKATKSFEKALSLLPADNQEIIFVARRFQKRKQDNWAIQTYLKGRKLINNDYPFSFELAEIYRSQNKFNEMINEYPNEPRHLYYLAQTYLNLNNPEKATEYYYKRAFFNTDKNIEEKHDALLLFAKINAFELKKPWEEYETYFKLYSELEPTRPDGEYFIGLYYYSINDKQTAFKYLKNSFEIGFPSHKQYSLRQNISYIFTPYYLSLLCYEFNDYELGYNACKLYLDNNKIDESFFQLMTDWYKIYSLLVAMPPKVKIPQVFDKPIFCIVADGGFTKWFGSNILTTGVGGSETWVIEMARYIKKLSNYEVLVFCNCENEEIFEEVKYIKLNRFLETIATIKIEHCIISRYTEYVPVSIHGHVENIYLISHDIKFTGNIIPIHPKLKKIFCLTEWHCKLFLESFPQFNDITKPLHYGIDFTHFFSDTFEKVPYSFIYSSFPNRGLIVVLKMWSRIIERYPKAKLYIFTDVNNEWANQFYKEELKEKNIFKNGKK